MNQILAFWVHPRSISTGFERIFIEGGDFKVLHDHSVRCTMCMKNESIVLDSTSIPMRL